MSPFLAQMAPKSTQVLPGLAQALPSADRLLLSAGSRVCYNSVCWKFAACVLTTHAEHHQ